MSLSKAMVPGPSMPRLAADDLSAVAGAVARSMQLVLSLAEETEATGAVEGGEPHEHARSGRAGHQAAHVSCERGCS